jgi:hypothetical protein
VTFVRGEYANLAACVLAGTTYDKVKDGQDE